MQTLYVGSRLLHFNSEVVDILVVPEFFYHFSKKGHLPDFFNDPAIVLELGRITINGIEKSSYIYSKQYYDSIKVAESPTDTRIADSELGIKLVKQFDGQMNRFLNALWFIKDNSVCSDGSQYINDVSKITLYSSKGEFFSNAYGMVSETNFSEKELDEAEDWYDIITEHTLMKTIGNVSYKDIVTLQGDRKEKISLSSFSRSLLYLNSARKNFFIPGKIASYTSLLETIFAVKGDNTKKVSERLSRFISNSKDEEILIYNNMKNLYDIRSSYVHGSDMKNTLEQELVEYSYILDSYVRRLMKKILLNHNELNYGKGTSKKFKEINLWFEELADRG